MTNKKKEILSFLSNTIKNPKCELYYTKDYELVLAVMLSAQTTDKKVNNITNDLFKEYDSLEKLKELNIQKIENRIKSIGLSKNKAKYFCEIVNKLSNYGYVPRDRKILEDLSGIGRKSANVILMELFNEPLIAVDTHVIRVSNRLGLTNSKDPNVIEKDLYNYFSKKEISDYSLGHLFVLFGRYFCTAKNPNCNDCKLKKYCNKNEKR